MATGRGHPAGHHSWLAKQPLNRSRVTVEPSEPGSMSEPIGQPDQSMVGEATSGA
jgi:hypothetical protein